MECKGHITCMRAMGNVRGRNNLGDLDRTGRIILKGYMECRRDSTGPK
jgi:hypothetical protein